MIHFSQTGGKKKDMANRCSNPICNKTINCLREGRVFVFASSTKTEKIKQLEEYWLCGECSVDYLLRKQNGKLDVVEREAIPA